MALKKVSLSLIMGVSAILLVWSCKHEIPADSNGGSGNGGNNPPVSSTCSPDSVYFSQQVLPVFVSNCAMSGCHDAGSHQEAIVLTSYQTIMSTGEIRPGNPNNSKAYRKIMDPDNNDRMPPPPRARLTQEQSDLIKKWILQGARNNSCQSAACDTANVTYSATIQPLITNNCQGCHSGTSASGGINLASYAGVKAKVDDGKLWGAVSQVPGFIPMPQNGVRLSACELAQLKKWMDAGAPNN